MRTASARLYLGSSPQVRGTYPIDFVDAERIRLIPAGAGNIRHTHNRLGLPRAHPRRCGEHTVTITGSNDDQGSSPQVRGTYGRHCRRVLGAGLIPAGAGNIIPPLRSRGSPGAHPRRCGEHDEVAVARGAGTGSSPQVRGTLVRSARESPCQRLIPAGAGNMSRRRSRRGPARAHPRRCGEHYDGPAFRATVTGSSPQVRGTCGEAGRDDGGHGLIPAGAGNISERPARRSPIRGSSPQVRGTSPRRLVHGHRLRLIPAGAGNITGSRRSRRPGRAHPRRCGEHSIAWMSSASTSGSSPQVRGTSSSGGGSSPPTGLIPAGAGNISTSTAA